MQALNKRHDRIPADAIYIGRDGDRATVLARYRRCSGNACTRIPISWPRSAATTWCATARRFPATAMC